MMKAAMTPGSHPQLVRIRTMRKEPHPWSITASGGQKMAMRTRRQDMGGVGDFKCVIG